MSDKLRKPARLTVDDLAPAVDRMGGVDGLAKWARRTPANERFFWTHLFPRLLSMYDREADGEAVITIRAAKWLETQ